MKPAEGPVAGPPLPARERAIRLTGYALAATFAVVALLFLVLPAEVQRALNWVGSGLDLPPAPVVGLSFYTLLAVAYMYVVTVLAVLVARQPRTAAYAFVLVHAKAASSVLSLALFILQDVYFVYLANFLVDGAVALLVYFLCLRQPRPTRARLTVVAGEKPRHGDGRAARSARLRLAQRPGGRRRRR